MLQPNLVLLKEISLLQEEIKSLESELDKAQQALVLVREKYVMEEIIEKKRLWSRGKNRLISNKIEQKILQIQQEEDELRKQLELKINLAIEEYFTEGYFTIFLEKLIKKLTSKGELTIQTSFQNKGFLPKNVLYQELSGDVLQIKQNTKIYELQPKYVKEILRERLLEKQLLTN